MEYSPGVLKDTEDADAAIGPSKALLMTAILHFARSIDGHSS